MRAILYGVEWEGSWRWCVSVAMEADAVWWARRGVRRIWLSERERSLGQAYELRDRLQKAGGRAVYQGFGDGSEQLAAGYWVETERLALGWRLDSALFSSLTRLLEGRCLLLEELESGLAYSGFETERCEQWLPYVQWGALEGCFKLRHGVVRRKVRSSRGRFRIRRSAEYVCLRCGSGELRLYRTYCPDCGQECPYCEACLGMGRVRFCSLLVQGVRFSPSGFLGGGSAARLAKWRLSPAQSEAVEEALRFLAASDDSRQRRKFLLWAVTGAGKTEMVFPLVEHTLAAGGRALVATPRKDVVLELAPRLKEAFPGERVVTLYGGSEERWFSGRITLATTHQLFRFREAFDLVVLDEIDAFPYHGDPQLAYAAETACSADGHFVLLSATPPLQLRKLAARGKLPHAKVCVRFHRYPLPVPRRVSMAGIKRWNGRLPSRLREALRKSVARGASCFVFVPYIGVVESVVRLLREAFPEVSIGGTSSKDELRGEKVAKFRDRLIQVIVTTTILERGVTVPKTDVFILDADNALFDDAALVQMAGRAGRKLEDPQGFVYFCAQDWTKSQRMAVREIRRMNKLAGRKGYLLK